MGKFVQDVVITFIARLLTLVVGIGFSVMLARSLGPQGKGVYTLSLLLPNIIVSFGNFGIGVASTYYIARSEFSRRLILGNIVLVGFGFGFLGVIAGALIIWAFGEVLFRDVPVFVLQLALVLVPVNLLIVFLRHILLGMGHADKYSYVILLQNGCTFVGFWAILKFVPGSIVAALAVYVISAVLAGVIAFYWAVRICGGIELFLNMKLVKKMLKFGVQAYLPNILSFVGYRADLLLINRFLGPTAVGIYTTAVGLAEKIWLLSHSAGTVLFPIVAGNKQSRNTLTPLVARIVLWLTIAGGMVLALASERIILFLYSQRFLSAAWVLRALLVGIALLAPARVLANDISGRGYPILNTYSATFVVLTNLFLNLLWIPRYGIMGAAWASSLSYALSFGAALWFYNRLTSEPWINLVMLQSSDFELLWRATKRLLRIGGG